MDRRTVGGVELAFRLSGDLAAQPIILIHGLTASSSDWSQTVGPLAAAGWRALSPDCPGHGGSSAPSDPASYRMEHVADLFHDLAKQLGFAPAVIVGNSMGGAIAQEYAIRHSADTRALVLVDSAGDMRRPIERPPGHADFAAREFKLATEQGIEAVWEMHQAERGFLYAGDLSPAVQAWRKARFCWTSSEGYLYGDRALGERRATGADLAKLRCTTLVVCCEHEQQFLKEVSEDLAMAIPGAQSVTIPRAWHSPQIENAGAFNEALLEFLSKA
jgi:pimeloyl-ACP methyl ester carboxylesterase